MFSVDWWRVIDNMNKLVNNNLIFRCKEVMETEKKFMMMKFEYTEEGQMKKSFQCMTIVSRNKCDYSRLICTQWHSVKVKKVNLRYQKAAHQVYQSNQELC